MKQLSALIFPGFELLDLFGPLEMFGMLDEDYKLELVAETAGPVASTQGVSAVADRALADVKTTDILLVPGGGGTRREAHNPQLLAWIGQASASADVTMSVCTGSLLLARAGVLDGRMATTNKVAFDWVVEQTKNVFWKRHARWVRADDIYTSSGVSAGIDMSLAVIANIHGDARARQVAGWAEYVWNDDPEDDPFAA